MSQRNKMAAQILASILTVAGLCGTARAADPSPTCAADIDDATAAQIVRALTADNQADLESILNAGSMDQLTPDQQQKLFQVVQTAAKRVMRSSPIA